MGPRRAAGRRWWLTPYRTSAGRGAGTTMCGGGGEFDNPALERLLVHSGVGEEQSGPSGVQAMGGGGRDEDAAVRGAFG